MESEKPPGFDNFDTLMRKLVKVPPSEVTPDPPQRQACPHCRKPDAMEKRDSPSGRYTEVECRFCHHKYGYGE